MVFYTNFWRNSFSNRANGIGSTPRRDVAPVRTSGAPERVRCAAWHPATLGVQVRAFPRLRAFSRPRTHRGVWKSTHATRRVAVHVVCPPVRPLPLLVMHSSSDRTHSEAARVHTSQHSLASKLRPLLIYLRACRFSLARAHRRCPHGCHCQVHPSASFQCRLTPRTHPPGSIEARAGLQATASAARVRRRESSPGRPPPQPSSVI